MTQVHCICGHPKTSVEHQKIVARLSEIRKKRQDLAAEMGALTQEESDLQSQLGSILYTRND